MTTTPARQRLIGDEIDEFIRHIDSLAESLPDTRRILFRAAKDSRERLLKFEQERGAVTVVGDKRTVRMPADHIRQWRKHQRHFVKTHEARELVARSMHVAMISQYDAYLGRLLRSLFLSRPELLNGSERSFTFSQISAYTSLDDLREHIVEKEVESVLRSSHVDQIRWMENRFDVPLTKGLSIWKSFVELTERRNLFVHTDGKVSAQYLVACREAGVQLPEGTVLGTTLFAPPDYSEQCHTCLFELGVKLGHVLWRKLLPAQREQADGSLNETLYDLLDHGKFGLAKTIGDFACETLKAHANERMKLAFLVNRAQAYKWSGDETKARTILQEVDWSAKSHVFQLADAVLKDEWSRALDIMVAIGPASYPGKVGYREWPLFKKFREADGFTETYRKIFGEDFDGASETESRPNPGPPSPTPALPAPTFASEETVPQGQTAQESAPS